MFEKLYEDLFRKRSEMINLKKDEPLPLYIEDLVEEFDQKAKVYQSDPKFEQLEVDPIDLQDTLRNE